MQKKNKHKEYRPNRTCNLTYSNYRRFKVHLREDFHRRCGYCDSFDKWSGGSRYYHVDHFKPKKHFPELERDYSNLIYACSYCNIFKSDDWPSEDVGRYIDPCEEDYNDYFSRDNDGTITCTSEQGEYMYKKLHFYLIRHSVIWNLTRIFKLLKEIDGVLYAADLSSDVRIQKLKERQIELAHEFIHYIDQFGED